MANGRPLWFLGGVVTVWTGVRIALLWPAALPLPTLDAEQVAAAEPTLSLAAVVGTPAVNGPDGARASRPTKAASPPRTIKTPERGAIMPAPQIASTDLAAVDAPPARRTSGNGIDDDRPIVISPPIVARPSTTSRLRIDAWLVARPSSGDALAFGQLGASQGGARLTYALNGDRRLALSARVSAPVRGAGSEAGFGVDIRPTRLSVHILVEERVSLDGGGMRPAAMVIAGTSAALPGRLRLDVYAQGGAVWRRGDFVDGAATVSRTMAERGRTRLELGGGTWGAAQRQVGRLDVGPSIAVVTPGARGTLRLQLDYRARVAGRARPGSGPTLTLGGSF